MPRISAEAYVVHFINGGFSAQYSACQLQTAAHTGYPQKIISSELLLKVKSKFDFLSIWPCISLTFNTALKELMHHKI